MLQFALLAMQAAGMVTDWLGTQQQIQYGRMGAKIERAGINANIAMARTQAEQASLDAMNNLRKTLGSQAAIMAARGTTPGVGTSLAIMNESVQAFNKDERFRKMNLAGREAELKAGLTMSRLHQMSSESQLRSEFGKRLFNTLPISSIASMNSGGANAGAGNASRAGGNYGMTPATY